MFSTQEQKDSMNIWSSCSVLMNAKVWVLDLHVQCSLKQAIVWTFNLQFNTWKTNDSVNTLSSCSVPGEKTNNCAFSSTDKKNVWSVTNAVLVNRWSILFWACCDQLFVNGLMSVGLLWLGVSYSWFSVNGLHVYWTVV